MKNLKRVSKASQEIIQGDRSTWLPLYYDIEKDTVYIKPGENRHRLTELIRPCSEEEISAAVNRIMAL